MVRRTSALTLALTLAAGGCATNRGEVQPTGGQPAGLPTAPVAQRQAPAEAVVRLLNVTVAAQPATTDSAPLAAAVKNAVEGKLTAQRFLIAQDYTDVAVTLTVKLDLFDRSGSFLRYNGQADVAVVLPAGENKLVGRERLTVEGERKRGEADAQNDVAAKLGAKVAEWVAGVCQAPSLGLQVMELIVRKPWYNLENLSAYIRQFTDSVRALDGVLSCTLANRDNQARTATFRIAYYPRHFPEGLPARLETVRELDLKMK